MKKYIYADNAATTKLSEAAFDAMLPWLKDNYANASQPYSFSRKAKLALKNARATIAECIGALPQEIYFTSGGTESDNWAIKCFGCFPTDIRYIYTTPIEHHAILNACEQVRRTEKGFVRLLPVNAQGYVQPTALETAFLSDRNRPVATCEVRLVSVMTANNEIGTIQPIKELAATAHKYVALFHTDAVQAIGHIKIDVNALGVDLLSASAHKFNGPKGIGFLYIRKGTPIMPYINGGAQESGMRAGTENVASIVGMAEALKENCESLEANITHKQQLESVLIDDLNAYGVTYRRNGGSPALPGLLSLSFPGYEGESILHRMDLMGSVIATGSACDSVNTEVSHVLKAIGLEEKYARGTIRISFGNDNTIEDAHAIAAALAKIVRK